MKLNGHLLDNGGLLTECWFKWSKNWPFDIQETPPQLSPPLAGSFGATITDTGIFSTIYYRACAQNADGYDEGVLIQSWFLLPTKTDQGPPWLPTHQSAAWAGPDIIWTLTTDIPCHLFIRVSDKPPWKQAGTHYKRGVVFHHAPNVYFAWHFEEEQQEPGDTTQHTFQFYFNFSCQTLWWYAYGTVDGKDSPSISPFYHQHYLEPTYTPACLYNIEPGEYRNILENHRHARPFKPLRDYICNKLTLDLSFQPDGTIQPCPYVTFGIYEADANGFPLGYPLRSQKIYIAIPTYPLWDTFTAYFTDLTLFAAHNYTWYIETPINEDMSPIKWQCGLRRGGQGTCYLNLYEKSQWCLYGVWQSWGEVGYNWDYDYDLPEVKP